MTISNRCRVSIRALAFAALTATVPALGGVARAGDDLAPAIEELGSRRAERPQPWQASLGVRSALFRGAGYDPFSTDDAFVQVSVTATRAFGSGPLTSAVGLLVEDGSQDGQARGAQTSLSLRRLGLVLEERFAPRPWLYGFARVVPASLRGTAELTDPSLTAPMRTTLSTFGLDASLGAAGRFTPRASHVGVWLTADAGYGWAPSQHLALVPALPATDRDKAGVTTLAALAPRGPFLRFALALTF